MRYHLTIKSRGAVPPCHAITVGRLQFQVYTQIVKGWNADNTPMPIETYRGMVGEYSDADLAEYREKVQHLVVRWGYREKRDGTREVWSAQVHDKRVPGYFFTANDEPLEQYLGIQPINVGVPAPLVGHLTPEEVAARQEADANEARAREVDPTDEGRRKRHARVKRDGGSVDA